MSERTGACLCGAARYRLTAEPLSARICWCRECQRVAGNGTANAMFPAAALTVAGPTADFLRTAESGNTIRMRFCPQCGSQLFSDSPGFPGLDVVRIGTLDDPSSIEPVVNIWSASAPRWACLDPALQRAERQPAPVRPPAAA